MLWRFGGVILAPTPSGCLSSTAPLTLRRMKANRPAQHPTPLTLRRMLRAASCLRHASAGRHGGKRYPLLPHGRRVPLHPPHSHGAGRQRTIPPVRRLLPIGRQAHFTSDAAASLPPQADRHGLRCCLPQRISALGRRELLESLAKWDGGMEQFPHGNRLDGFPRKPNKSTMS